MDEVQLITIPPHPLWPTVSRKVAILAKNEDYDNRNVTLVCELRHQAQGAPVPALRPVEEKRIALIADDSSLVDPATGKLLPPNTPGGVGQYTWLKAAIEAGANPFTIAEGAVQEAATLGRFD